MTIPESPLTAGQIYDQISTGDRAESLNKIRDQLLNLCKTMSQRTDQMYQLNKNINDTWQGEAGSMASESAYSFADAAAKNVSELVTATQAIDDQISAFNTAFTKVVPVNDEGPEFTKHDLFKSLMDGHTFKDKMTKWQNDSNNNIQAFGEYHGNSLENGQRMPPNFRQLYIPTNEFEDTNTSVIGSPLTPNHEHVTTSRVSGHSKSKQSTPEPGTALASGVVGGQQSAVSGFDHPSESTHTTATSFPTNEISSSWHDLPPMQTPASANIAGTPTGNISPLDNGGFNGFNGSAYNPGSGYNPGGGVGQEPGNLAGKGNPGRATGTGIPANESVVTRAANGGMASAGKPGTGTPLAGAPGVAGKQDEDHEHQRAPYLQEADPDDLFLGGLERTTAPVIGETRRQEQ